MSCETELEKWKEAQQDFIDAAFTWGDADSDATFTGWLLIAATFSGNGFGIATAGAAFLRQVQRTEEARDNFGAEFKELCDAAKEAMNCAQNSL